METLKKRAEFLAVSKGGRIGRRAFLIQGLARKGAAQSRVGYTVTKKTGNSVVRSRIKRRLRAVVAALDPKEVPTEADFVIVARQDALTAPFPKMIADLKSGLVQVLDPRTPRGPRRPQKRTSRSQSSKKQR